MTRALIVSGAGGVGKTTISAALAASAARDGISALVVTVDPARRLADALGFSLGNDPEPVPGFTGLSAAMLDMTTSWEAIAHRYAEPDVADRLLADPFFRAIADRFPAAQSFAAGERLAELVESGGWDLIVVDTPPSGGGIDFFLAPSRIRELVGGKLLTWLTGARIPGRRAFYRIAARPALRLADTVLGGPLLEQVGDFLIDLRTMYDGLSVRARTIGRHLARADTMIVTTADPTPMREARRFFAALPEVDVVPGAVLFNRALPVEWAGAVRMPLRGIEDADVRTALGENLKRWGAEARRQEDARAELAKRHRVPIVTIPWMAVPPDSVDDLVSMIDRSTGMSAVFGD